MLALPAVLVVPWNPDLGLGLAIGILPVAGVVTTPRRRGRVVSLMVATVCGLSLTLGSLLAQNAMLAMVSLFGLGLGAALLASRRRAGRLGVQLAFPLVGVGLSFAFPASVPVAGLMILGGAYAWAVSLLWPERPMPARNAAPLMTKRDALDYGIRLGCAGAIAAGLGFWFGLDHKGWVCAAALMVMRPTTDALVARGLGRALSVFVGAFLGALFMLGPPTPIVMATTLGLVLAAMSATQASRWYMTAAFTTFVVFVLLLWNNPTDAPWRFLQRNLETLLGIAVALVFGVAVPLLLKRQRT